MSNIDFYYHPLSAPCRSVLLTAEALGVKLNYKLINLALQEQLKPEFLKINPEHTIPTISDNGYHLWESHAIVTYLATTYGKNDSLYPKDPKQRGIVDQRLFFDAAKLNISYLDWFYTVLIGGTPNEEKRKKVEEVLQMFDTLLENAEYAAGDHITVADFCLVATVSTIEFVGFDLSQYKRVTKWFKKVKDTAPGYEELNEKNLQPFRAFLDEMKRKHNAS